MNYRTSKTRAGRSLLTVLGLTGALLTLSGAARADHSSDADPVGAWTVQVTLRDCATGDPLGPPFNSLVSFQEGGTISESAGGTSFAPGQRSPGHGAWTRKSRRTFVQKMIALLLFDTEPNLPGTPTFDPSLPITPGFLAGSLTITHTVKLSDADHFTSSGTNAFYKIDGTVYRTGCSTAEGQRFE